MQIAESNCFDLLPRALRLALAQCSIVRPTAFQQLALPRILSNRDANFAMRAQTGSGKTLCYLLPLLTRLLTRETPAATCSSPSEPPTRTSPLRALALVPSMALAHQICAQALPLMREMPFDCALSVTTSLDEIQLLARGTANGGGQRSMRMPSSHVLVATTPDLVASAFANLARNPAALSDLEMLIIDEADLLLTNAQFADCTRSIIFDVLGDKRARRRLFRANHTAPPIGKVPQWLARTEAVADNAASAEAGDDCAKTPAAAQIVALGATFDYQRLMRTIVPNLQICELPDGSATRVPEHIDEQFVHLPEDSIFARNEALMNVLRQEHRRMRGLIVFVNNTQSVIEVERLLLSSRMKTLKRNLIVYRFSGSLVKSKEREVMMADFQVELQRVNEEAEQANDGDPCLSSRLPVLITTDLLSRGIDFLGVSHVVQYEVALKGRNYFHRVGRTGRGEQKSGTAISFYTDENEITVGAYMMIAQGVNVSHPYQVLRTLPEEKNFVPVDKREKWEKQTEETLSCVPPSEGKKGDFTALLNNTLWKRYLLALKETVPK